MDSSNQFEKVMTNEPRPIPPVQWATDRILQPNGGTGEPIPQSSAPVAEPPVSPTFTPPTSPTFTPPTPPTVTPTPTTPAPEDRPQLARTTEFEALNRMVKDAIGYSIDDFMSTMDQMSRRLEEYQPVVTKYQEQMLKDQLKNLWQVDETEFRNRLNLVQEAASKLSPEEYRRLDQPGAAGVDAIDLFYRRIRDSQRPSHVPVFDTSSASRPYAQQGLDQSKAEQLLKSKEAGSHWQEILQAYSRG